LSHMWHLYRFSPMWTLMWVFRLPDSLNALSHTWHLYGFSPLWILLCLTRLPACVNRLLQTLHSNGFSPEWIRLCTAKLLLLPKLFPHSVHLYLLLWIFICCLKHSWFIKHLLHCVHKCEFPSLCAVSLWYFKPFLPLNGLSHTVHKYGLGLSSYGCSVISLLSPLVFTSTEVSPVQYAHNIRHASVQTALAILQTSKNTHLQIITENKHEYMNTSRVY